MTIWEAHIAAHVKVATVMRNTPGEIAATPKPGPAHQAALDLIARRRTEIAQLAEAVVAEEERIHEVLAAVRAPVTLSDIRHGPAAPALPWEDAVGQLRAELAAADDAYGDVWQLGRRARLFPGMGQTARTALIFFLCSIPTVVLNVIVATSVFRQSVEAGAEPSWNGAFLLCTSLGLLALTWGAAAVVTVTAGRPRATSATDVLPGMVIGTALCLVFGTVAMCLSQPLSLR